MNYTTNYGTTEKVGNTTLKKSFVGTYRRVGAKLTHSEEPTIRLVIGTRLKPTKNKPKHFLLLMVGRAKSAIYFSSMYQTNDPSVFEVEHEKVRYVLVMDTDKAEMLLSNPVSQAA